MEHISIGVVIAALGFLVQCGGMIAAGVWSVSRIKMANKEAIARIEKDLIGKIAEEREHFTEVIGKMVQEFSAGEKTQDDRFGETCAAIREYTSIVERRLHEHELWSVNNFVQKGQFESAIKEFKEVVRDLAREVKEDMLRVESKLVRS